MVDFSKDFPEYSLDKNKDMELKNIGRQYLIMDCQRYIESRLV
jgi:hypothetical protein